MVPGLLIADFRQIRIWAENQEINASVGREHGDEFFEGKLCYPPHIEGGRIVSFSNAQIAVAIYIKSPEIAEPPRAHVSSDRHASSDQFAIIYLKQLQAWERGRALHNKFRLDGIKTVAPPALVHDPNMSQPAAGDGTPAPNVGVASRGKHAPVVSDPRAPPPPGEQVDLQSPDVL